MSKIESAIIDSIFVKIKEDESVDIDIIEYDIHLDNGKKYISRCSIGDCKVGDKVDVLLYEDFFNPRNKECIILNNENAKNILKEDKKTGTLISLNIFTSVIGIILIFGTMLVKGLDIDLSGAMLMCSGILLLSLESWKIGSFKLSKSDRKYIEKIISNKSKKEENINIKIKEKIIF